MTFLNDEIEIIEARTSDELLTQYEKKEITSYQLGTKLKYMMWSRK